MHPSDYAQRTQDEMPEPVCTAPVTRYARAGTFHIACQIVGTGTPDVVFVPAFWSHLDSAD